MNINLKDHLFFVATLISLSLFSELQAKAPTSDSVFDAGVVAFDDGLYEESRNLFEQSVELDRSNYQAVLHLAKAYYILGKPNVAIRHASSIASSFYPSKQVKIEAFLLLSDIYSDQAHPWLALGYTYAASELSTNVDISHLVDDQMKKIDFDSLPYPEFSNSRDGILTSSALTYQNGQFGDQKSNIRFSPTSFSVSQLDSRFVVLAAFDQRKRFSKVLLIRIKNGLRPKLEEISIQGRKRSAPISANDLYVKVMDWSFDGYPDIVVRSDSKSKSQAFLIFNPKNEKFQYNEVLSKLDNPILDRNSQSIIQESCVAGRGANCSRYRYKLFAGKFALAQFERNVCQESCVYTNSEIEVSSLVNNEHMYLVHTIETEFNELETQFGDNESGSHSVVTRRVLKAYYSSNYEVGNQEQPIMFLDLDGSWEFPASYVKGWVNNYFNTQPLNNQLTKPVLENRLDVVN